MAYDKNNYSKSTSFLSLIHLVVMILTNYIVATERYYRSLYEKYLRIKKKTRTKDIKHDKEHMNGANL